MIKINNLSVSYGTGLPDIFSNISINVPRGCILNILGQNAVGKTTLIRTLTRELKNYRGSIKIVDKEISTYSISSYSKILGVVSSSYNAYQNLVVADYLVTGFLNQMKPFSRPRSELFNKAYGVIDGLGKPELFNKSLHQLSSGEKQIVMIARVLLQKPEIIIFDEPTANLDIKNQMVILNQIKNLASLGYSIVMTTHNPGHAYSLGGKTLLMKKGKYCFGDTNEVITAQSLSEYYELDVNAQTIDTTPIMIFQENNDKPGVKLVF